MLSAQDVMILDSLDAIDPLVCSDAATALQRFSDSLHERGGAAPLRALDANLAAEVEAVRAGAQRCSPHLFRGVPWAV